MTKYFSVLLLFLFTSLNAEVMNFDIRYLGLTVVKSTFTFENNSLVVTAKSTGVAKLLKNMDNKYIAKYPIEDSLFLPVYYKKIINQNSYREKRQYFYNRINKRAKRTDFYNKNLNKEYNIPADIRDFFSTLFYLRKNLNDSLDFDIDANTIFWKGKAKFRGIEKVTLADTTVSTKKYEITYEKITKDVKKENSDMLTNNLVGNKKKLYLWFTRDERHIPVKAQFKVKLFSVYWFLTDYKN